MHRKLRAPQLSISLKLFLKPEFIVSVVCVCARACALKMCEIVSVLCLKCFVLFCFVDGEGEVLKNNVHLGVPSLSLHIHLS